MPIKITRVTETQELTDLGKTVASVRIEFNIGAHGPFSISLPKAGFTSTTANAKIQEYAQHVQQLQGLS